MYVQQWYGRISFAASKTALWYLLKSSITGFKFKMVNRLQMMSDFSIQSIDQSWLNGNRTMYMETQKQEKLCLQRLLQFRSRNHSNKDKIHVHRLTEDGKGWFQMTTHEADIEKKSWKRITEKQAFMQGRNEPSKTCHMSHWEKRLCIHSVAFNLILFRLRFFLPDLLLEENPSWTVSQ